MSAVVQGTGYCFAAVAPTLLGYVHGLSGSWTVPLLMILGSVAIFAILGLIARALIRRARQVDLTVEPA